MPGAGLDERARFRRLGQALGFEIWLRGGTQNDASLRLKGTMITVIRAIGRFVGRILVGTLAGALLLTIGYLVNSTLDPLFGVNVAEAALGAALIGAVLGAVCGLLYSIPLLRRSIRNIAEAVLNAAV